MLHSRRSVLLASIAACIVAWTSAPGSALGQQSHEHASGTAASDKLKLDAGGEHLVLGVGLPALMYGSVIGLERTANLRHAGS